MYSKILNADRWVKINNLKEIKDPIYLSGGRPTPEGLFSYDIFGITPTDRKSIFAYINLGARFLHPLTYLNLKRYSRNMEHIIAGTKTYKFENGDFVEDPNGSTGIDFLYENYDKIKWKNPSTMFPGERIIFLKQDKDNLFLTKFPVVPPFYRDIDDSSEIGVDEVNDMYKKVIQQSSVLKKRSGSFAMFGHITRMNIQSALNDIFIYFIFGQIHGKHGLFKASILGANIDRSVRLVITAPKIVGSNRYTDMASTFDKTGVPLAAALAMGWDFMVKAVKDFFDNEFIRGGKYPYINSKGERITLTFKHPEIDFSEDVIKHKMEQFVHGQSTRFETIKLPENKEGIDGYMYIAGRFDEASDHISSRKATWTDVFFMMAKRMLENKKMHITVTRYPVEDYNGVYNSEMRILSTTETCKARIGDDVFDFYPIVVPDGDSSNAFADTLVPSNLYLEALGADLDSPSESLHCNVHYKYEELSNMRCA